MLIFLNKSASLVTMSRILKRTCSLEYQTTYVFLFSTCNKQKNSLPYAIKFEKSLRMTQKGPIEECMHISLSVTYLSHFLERQLESISLLRTPRVAEFKPVFYAFLLTTFNANS